MKRKCTSYGDMIKTVASCKHPRLKSHQRNLLNVMATCASINGANIRPTYKFMQEALGVTRQHIGRVLNQIYGLGILELTHHGVGEGNASIWRIVLEHESFPETYATRKETPSTQPERFQNATFEEPERNLSVASTQPPEVAPSNPFIPTVHPTNHPEKIAAKPKPQLTKMPDGWMDRSPQLATMGMPTAKEQKQLCALGSPYLHPWRLLREFICDWQDVRPRGMTGLAQPWLAFFRECSAKRLDAFTRDSHARSLLHLHGYEAAHEEHMKKVMLKIAASWSFDVPPEQIEERRESERRSNLTDEQRQQEDQAEADELFGRKAVAPTGGNEEPA